VLRQHLVQLPGKRAILRVKAATLLRVKITHPEVNKPAARQKRNSHQ
jgi:hypothetical protein